MNETEEVYENPNKKPDENINKPSKLWYLLPIFFGIIGGIIGYFLIKDKDRKMAKNLIICAIAILVVEIILSFSILAFYGLNAPQEYTGPQARGFGEIQVLYPWSIAATNGYLTLKIQNTLDNPIVITSIKGTISNQDIEWSVNEGSIDSRNSTVITGTVSSGTWSSIDATQGTSYFASITIYYTYSDQTFSSSGTIRGTYN